MTSSEHVGDHLPLTEATFFILLSLAVESKHGYSIMKDVQHLSSERVVLSTGTLYGVLKRLLEQGWIVRQDQPSAADSSRGQKTYLLSELGRRILGAETQRLQSLVQISVERGVLEGL